MLLAMPDAHRRAIAAFADRVRASFGPRLRHVRLFGSWARGTAHADSDIDIAVVIDDLTRDEWRAIIDAATQTELEHDVVLGPYVCSSAHFAALVDRGRSLGAAIMNEGIAL